MQDDDSGVAVSRWLYRAAPDALRWATAEVGVFADAHGSCPATLVRVTAAVSEALVQVFDAESTVHAGTVVDAATDGLWLTVRLQGPGSWPAASTEARLSVLADRVELSFDESSDSMTALFEFPSDAEGDGGEAPGRSRAPVATSADPTPARRCAARRRRATRPQRSASRRRPAR